MNTQEIARHLLNRRNTMNPAIYPGEMIASLGAEAMQEALQKRWLVANHESGLLQVSSEMGKVEEMRDVSDKCPTCGKAECGCTSAVPATASHGYAFEHATRRIGSGSPLEEAVRVQELLSPGTGHDTGSPLSRAPGAPVPPVPLTPTTPPTAAPTSPAAPTGADGKPVGTATAKDGKLQVNLDPNSPAARQLAATQ